MEVEVDRDRLSPPRVPTALKDSYESDASSGDGGSAARSRRHRSGACSAGTTRPRSPRRGNAAPGGRSRTRFSDAAGRMRGGCPNDSGLRATPCGWRPLSLLTPCSTLFTSSLYVFHSPLAFAFIFPLSFARRFQSGDAEISVKASGERTNGGRTSGRTADSGTTSPGRFRNDFAESGIGRAHG